MTYSITRSASWSCMDFQRVDPNAKLHIKVPLHFVNADVAPGVKLGGGNISHVLNEVEVSCLPDAIC